MLMLRELAEMKKSLIDASGPMSGQVDYVLEADPPGPTHTCNLGKVCNIHRYIILAF